ncbi:MAG TPA: hypothetical protein VFY59_07495 [Rubrobacter sp.]|nr:hypothetical protein [Rubrobacter sp.]
MKRLTILVLLVTTLALGACSAQTREPQADGSSGASERPKTVVVYKDAGEADDGGSDAGKPREGGGILVNDDDPDGVDDLDADERMRSGQRLPADFPIPVPDEYRVGAVGVAGNETAVILSVPSGEDAYNYYRQFLTDRGFRLVDEGRSQGGFLDAELEFSNNALEGSMDFDGDTVEVDIERF